jgi:hypothetical protein
MDARSAWNACGKPKGESGIQNIRVRGMKERGKKAYEATMFDVAVSRGENLETPLPQEEAEAKRIGVPEKGFRLRTNQLQKQKSIDVQHRAAFNEAYVAATLEWQQMVREGKCGKGDMCSSAVATRYAKTLPASCKFKLTGRCLINVLAQGRCGKPQAARGSRK